MTFLSTVGIIVLSLEYIFTGTWQIGGSIQYDFAGDIRLVTINIANRLLFRQPEI